MNTCFRGAFVISWSQTEVDGLNAAPLHTLSVGAAWSWSGDVVRVDGPSEILRLEGANGEIDCRKRAARLVRRLVGAVKTNTRNLNEVTVDDPLIDCGFVVSDGAQSYTVTVIEIGGGTPPLLMFVDRIPPAHTEMWVVHHTMERMDHLSGTGPETGGVICFTPGTRIETPEGPRLVEELREGDMVQTKDDGAQPIEWVGCRRMSGARLFAMPHLRPIRISAGALGIDRPQRELLVSPGHRMLVKGRVAQALFNTSEVLVAARDLVNNRTVVVDVMAREVTYIHLLLPRHQVLWANGVETESFHPAGTALSTLSERDRKRLLEREPDLQDRPESYGRFARRCLSTSEAAILMHEAA
ncbi:Hint domain-containing protein [Roseovarius litoreus]|uniref:Hint domain-containing protein n=1 Tax=Roseovarius litoreus TaxID=1155722 RepID=A0A1M7HM31_9RHOB|nr:Hint domain-containing protein [Roseovarius litoreus]SHM29510.1 Hint domain-containing protein [Roseovarius litoreus]